jgi:deazaflavin-dependent oxidoreductase (nitroreductase family)
VTVDAIRQALLGFVQRLDRTRPGVLAIGRIVSPLQRELYRTTGGRLSLTGRAPVLLLATTGRRTGKAWIVPLFCLRDGDRLVICNVNPGFEQPNPWILNLRAEPHARVQIGRRATMVRARPAPKHELATADQAMTRLPGFLRQRRRASRLRARAERSAVTSGQIHALASTWARTLCRYRRHGRVQ